VENLRREARKTAEDARLAKELVKKTSERIKDRLGGLLAVMKHGEQE